MKKNTQYEILALAIVVVIILFAVSKVHTSPLPLQHGQPSTIVSYACDAQKSIQTAYYSGSSSGVTKKGEPPISNASVVLTLSDSRIITLPHALSADGARYASADEATVFWNKGRGITFTENGQQTYSGCIEIASDTGTLPQVYENSMMGISIRYPVDYVTDATYKYQLLGPGKEIAGVKFTIPKSISQGTNLSSDTYISVEEIPHSQTCSANLFLQPTLKSNLLTEGNMTYSFASTSDAAAGNRYEETIYALPSSNPCIAIRYFIHYGAFQNYPAGSITEFNKQAVLNTFDAIRRSLIISQ